MTPVPTVEGYTDLVPIGAGGIGDVYRAVCSATGATVAVKLLRDITDHSVAWHRTRRELHALRALDGHPHVIQVVDVLGDVPGFVMDHAPGGSVSALLDRAGPTLPVPDIVMIGRDTASALQAAHAQGIIHRDVKPQNLLIDIDGRIRLCDFGIASLTRSDEFRTRTSARSMRYASPEDLEEDVQVGPATDVYSLGATLVHLLRGSPPTLKERLSPWEPTSTDDADRTELERIIADCLHPEPEHRPTPDEVLRRLASVDDRLPESCLRLPIVEPAPLDSPGSIPPHSDDTVRHGRQPPPPIARPGESGSNRRGRHRGTRTAIGGLVIAFLIIGLVITGPLDGVLGRPPSDRSDVPRPAGLVPLDDPAIVWPLGAVGDCLVQIDGDDILQTVPCDAPHDLERFHAGTIDDVAPPGTEVSAELLDIDVESRCLAAAPATEPNSPIRIATSGPTVDTWARGDRTFQCFLGIPGRRTSGSFSR